MEWLCKEKSAIVEDRKKLLQYCPVEFVKLYEILRAMDFESMPDYEEFNRILYKLLTRKQCEKQPLDWDLKSPQPLKKVTHKK